MVSIVRLTRIFAFLFHHRFENHEKERYSTSSELFWSRSSIYICYQSAGQRIVHRTVHWLCCNRMNEIPHWNLKFMRENPICFYVSKLNKRMCEEKFQNNRQFIHRKRYILCLQTISSRTVFLELHSWKCLPLPSWMDHQWVSFVFSVTMIALRISISLHFSFINFSLGILIFQKKKLILS